MAKDYSNKNRDPWYEADTHQPALIDCSVGDCAGFDLKNNSSYLVISEELNLEKN